MSTLKTPLASLLGLRLPFALAGLLLMAPMGCGGSDSPSPAASPSPSPSASPVVVAPKSAFLSFQWGERSRYVGVDASRITSALSATVRVYTNGVRAGTPKEFKLNRVSSPNAYADKIELGTTTETTQAYFVEASLYSGSNQSGVLVGTANFVSTIDNDSGELNNSLAVNGVVRSVAFDIPNTTLAVGGTVDVTVTAKDAAGSVVPVSPGSATFAVTDTDGYASQDKVAPVLGGAVTVPYRLRGVAKGTALVRAVVDDIASPPVTVVVTP